MLYKKPQWYFIARQRKQKGATLVIALIIMLVMSVIGISNMQSSTLQERMAANSRQKSVAKYAAESAVNVAEKWLDSNLKSIADLSQFDGQGGLYSSVRLSAALSAVGPSTDIADTLNPNDWGSITAYQGVGNLIDSNLVSKQPQFIIEYIGRDYRGSASKVVRTDNLSNIANNSSSKPYFFRITAIGWGKDTNIYSILESIYKTGSSEYFHY